MRTLTKTSLLSALLVLIGVVAGAGTWSAYNALTQNTGNAFAAGSVEIGNSSAGTAVVTLAAAKPGDTVTGCITVTSTGTLASNLKLYGSTTGTGLDAYLDMKVTRGTGTTPNCSNFVADTTDHLGKGPGVLFNGLLSTYPGTVATGISDPDASWVKDESRAYKFTVTLPAAVSSAAQGKTTTETFIWEATNN